MSIEPVTDENIRGLERAIGLLSGRIVAIADRITVLESAFAEQHAVNNSVANTLNTILEILKEHE